MGMNLLTLLLPLLLHIPLLNAKPQCDTTDTKKMSCSEKEFNSIPKIGIHNSIEVLDMSQNDLEELFGVDFSEYSSLTTLYLNDNSISYIEDDTFENLLKLEFIDLSKNLLEEVPDNIIINNKQLSVLDLSENLFQSQTPELISDSLEVLDLSQSKLSYFTNRSIANLPNLRLLYLNSNNLISLDDRMFSIPKLFYYVQIDFNPWECTCNTVKMLKKLTDSNLFQVTQPIYCVDDNKSHVHIYDKDGPKICKTKRKVKQEITTISNSVQLNGYSNDINLKNIYLNDAEIENTNYEQITNGIKYLEEILNNEKIYFQELKKEKDVLDSVALWTVKIFILVIFFSGIGLGILISALMNRKIRRVKSRTLLKSESIPI